MKIKKYKNVLFDLDGTIVNSFMGIKNAILYAIEKHSLVKLDEDTLKKFVGPPLDESFKKYLGVSDEKAHELILSYREYYAKTGLYESHMYEGIENVIKTLHDRGYNIYLASAKPRDFALEVLRHYKQDKYFTDFFTASNDNTKEKKIKHKKEVLEYAINIGSIDKNISIMIGDRIDDVLSAYELGIDTIACEYGFGSNEEFEKASYRVENAIDILKIL